SLQARDRRYLGVPRRRPPRDRSRNCREIAQSYARSRASHLRPCRVIDLSPAPTRAAQPPCNKVPMIEADLRKRRLRTHATWHLDEVYLKIGGRMVYLWRAVDAEGEVLDVLVQSKRNKQAALKLMRKLLKKYAFVPERLVTDDLRISGRWSSTSLCMRTGNSWS